MAGAPKDLRFRPFALEDAAHLGAWLQAVGLGVPRGVADQTWARRLIEDPHISCWAAEDPDGSRLGFFRLDTGPDQQAELTIIVGPGLRRRGLGTALLEEALSQARSRGLRRILAVVEDENDPAMGFFSAAGFHSVGRKTPGNTHLERLIHRADRQPPLEIQP